MMMNWGKWYSSDQIVDYIPREISQSIIATAIVIGQLRVVDPKLVENCCVNVVHMHRVLNRLPTKVVGGAVRESALEAAARQSHREPVRVVIAPIVRLPTHERTSDFDNRRAAKL